MLGDDFFYELIVYFPAGQTKAGAGFKVYNAEWFVYNDRLNGFGA